MDNKTSMKDAFEGISFVFDPNVTYEGNYGFPLISLFDCSKVVGNKNLVEDYFDKNYLKDLFSLLIDFRNVIGDIFLLSDERSNGKGRVLKISLELLTDNICRRMLRDAPQLVGDYKDFKEILRVFFKNYKSAITILQNKGEYGESKEYCEKIKQLYEFNEDVRRKKYGEKYVPLSFDSYLEKLRCMIVRFLVIYNRLVQICDKEINLDNLEECLDLDKFYFVIAKHLIDVSKMSEQLEGFLHNSFIFVDVYCGWLKQLMENQQYDLRVTFHTIDGRVVSMDANDLLREFYELKNRHPEFKTYVFDGVEGIDYRDKNVVSKVEADIRRLKDSKELVASWKFVRKGESVVPYQKGSGNKITPKQVKTIDEKNKELRERIDFLEGTSYLYRIEGINNFSGYIGYIYENGFVIFEKFYRDTVNYEPDLSNATYVMNLENFVEMSKKTKVEIMNYIKDGNTDVQRKYHTEKWKQNILNIINGTGYSIEALALIDNLVDGEEIVKKGTISNG